MHTHNANTGFTVGSASIMVMVECCDCINVTDMLTNNLHEGDITITYVNTDTCMYTYVHCIIVRPHVIVPQ